MIYSSETYLWGGLTALIATLLGMPILIKVAHLKNLVDAPGEDRKLHKRSIPTVGGIMIFAAILFSISFWYKVELLPSLQMEFDVFKNIMACLVIVFFIGVKDDIIGTAPLKKLVAHIVVACIMVFAADVKISGMHGLFGIHNFTAGIGEVFSVFVFVVVLNAFNLIDGLDGLAGGVGLIASLVFGIWFQLTDQYLFGLISYVTGGALLGFLWFNFQPAKVFLGDSGSLVLGTLFSVLAITLIETPYYSIPVELKHISTPVLTMVILAYPLVDTLRVFTIRLKNGQSPFSADKRHIHHKYIALGFSHRKAVVHIYTMTLFMISVVWFVPFTDSTQSFIVTIFIVTLWVFVLQLLNKKKNASK